MRTFQPERIVGNDYTIKSDVWSSGLVLIELLLKQFPYPSHLPLIELLMHITSNVNVLLSSEYADYLLALEPMAGRHE